MIDIMSWVYEWMGVILAALVIPLITLIIIGSYLAANKKTTKQKMLCLLPTIGMWVFIIIFGITINALARIAVVNEVERIASGNNFEVYIEGEEYESPYEVSTAFEENQFFSKRSGSHPTEGFDVNLKSSNGEMKFVFFRDSRDRDVYWISYRGYNRAYKVSHNGSFHLKTNLLNDF